MPNPYGLDLRERAVAAYEAGEGSYADIADRFSVAKRTLERWVERGRRTGSVAAIPERRRTVLADRLRGHACGRP